ncbi:MAG: hypothetical protein AB7F19_02850 [Candidatus Babeliales bacterium]
MLKSKHFTSKAFHAVIFAALMAQSSVHAFSVTAYADAAKKVAQASVTFVHSKANNAVAALKKDQFAAGYFTAVGGMLGVVAVVAIIDKLDNAYQQRKLNNHFAALEKERAQAQAQIDALSFEDLLKLINADVIEAQTLVNEVDGPRIAQINRILTHNVLLDEVREELINELTFLCAAAQQNYWYNLSKAEAALQNALSHINRRLEITQNEIRSNFASEREKVKTFIVEIRALRSIVSEYAARYECQVSAEFNEKVAQYRAQNPTRQVKIHVHTCGHDCLKAMACECANCACSAQITVQS